MLFCSWLVRSLPALCSPCFCYAIRPSLYLIDHLFCSHAPCSLSLSQHLASLNLLALLLFTFSMDIYPYCIFYQLSALCTPLSGSRYLICDVVGPIERWQIPHAETVGSLRRLEACNSKLRPGQRWVLLRTSLKVKVKSNQRRKQKTKRNRPAKYLDKGVRRERKDTLAQLLPRLEIGRAQTRSRIPALRGREVQRVIFVATTRLTRSNVIQRPRVRIQLGVEPTDPALTILLTVVVQKSNVTSNDRCRGTGTANVFKGTSGDDAHLPAEGGKIRVSTLFPQRDKMSVHHSDRKRVRKYYAHHPGCTLPGPSCQSN